MIRRCLIATASFYPTWILAMLWMVALPSSIFLRVESWEVLPFGILPQSAALNDMQPSSILVIVAGLLASIYVTRTRLILCCASLIPMPYWVFLLRDHQFAAGSAGILVSLAGLVESQRNLSAERYWERVLEAWAPYAVGAFIAGAIAFGSGFWYAGAFAAGPLAVSAAIAAAVPVQVGREPRFAGWKIALGIVLAVLCRNGLSSARSYLNESRHARTVDELRRLPEEAARPYEKYSFHRGISFVADRAAYGSDSAHDLLKQLKRYGVDSIAIVIHGITPRPYGERESDAEIELLTRRAHALGMKVMLKPHHRPRDPEDLASAAARAAWFAKHTAGIEHFGKLAARIHADLFCIGYEMGEAYQYEAEWRSVIAKARAVYPGPLTACPSQGKQFEGIRFWDALDYIGLDNYYPIDDSYDYEKVVRTIERVQKQFNKPVLFTEAGFASAEGSHREPWAEPRRPLSLEEQANCYRALWSAVSDKPWFMGVYWWKVDTDGAGGPEDRTLTPWRKPAIELVKLWYSRRRELSAH